MGIIAKEAILVDRVLEDKARNAAGIKVLRFWELRKSESYLDILRHNKTEQAIEDQ